MENKRKTAVISSSLEDRLGFYSENDVTIQLAVKLINMGYRLRTEVKVRWEGHRGARFDVVTYKNNKPYSVIEVKKSDDANLYTKQYYRYKKMLDIPVYVCNGLKGIDYIVSKH